MTALQHMVAAREALAGIAYGLDPDSCDYPLLLSRNGVIGSVPLRTRKPFGVRRLLLEIADRRRVSVEDIRGRSRWAALVLVRKECAYRLRAELGLSWPRIGELLGDRDHSSVMYLAACWQAMHPYLPRVSAYDLAGKERAQRAAYRRARGRLAA